MRKSLLILMAAFGLTTTATAQVAVASDFRDNAARVTASTELAASEQAVTAVAGPMRSIANGVWYKRPEGTFLRSSSTYRYAIVPPFTRLTWTNMCTDPASAVWKYGVNAPEGDYDASQIVDNNLVTKYGKNTGLGAYYGPFIVSGDVSFGILDSQLPTGQLLVVAPDTISELAHVSAAKMVRFTDFLFGNNPPETADRDGKSETFSYSRFFEYFKAPAQPLYLEGISFMADYRDGVTEAVTPSSVGVKCYVVQAGPEAVVGRPETYTDTVAVIPINTTDAEISEYREGYYFLIKAYCMQEDEFGGVKQPVVIDRDFVLIFDGFNNEGVNFGIVVSNVADEERYYNGGAYPTVFHAIWESDGARKSSHWNYNEANQYQYNMLVDLNGMFDVAAVDEDCLEMTAPEAGGAAYAVVVEDGVEKNYPGVYIQTVFHYHPEGSRIPSYQIEGLPEWLSIADVVTDYYTAENGWVTILNLVAQPMPEGTIGRVAKLRFTSAMGAKSEEFTIIQGDKSVGIEMMETTEIQKNGAEYNLAGQRVGKDYKGIVVKNGKKIFKH